MVDHCDARAPSPAYAISASSTTDETDGDENNLNLKIKSTTQFKVKKSDKIKKLKKACSKEGVSENIIDLTQDESVSADEQTVADNNVSVLTRKLLIKIPCNPQLNMMVVANVNDTATSVKYMIANKLGCNPYSYDLMYKGRLLPPRATLDILNIPTQSILYLIKIPQDLVWISVHTPNVGMVSFQIRKLQTVGYAKVVIGSMINSRVDEAGILLGAKALEDSRTLASYCIDDHTVLQLIYPFQVSLKLYKDRTLTLNVLASDDLGVIHRKVFDQHGIVLPFNPISFQGRRLVVGYSLASYGVKKDSLLKVGRPLKRTVQYLDD